MHSTIRQRALQPSSEPPKDTVDRLIVEQEGPGVRRTVPLEDCYQAVELHGTEAGELRIRLGRGEECDVVINDVSVSRVHAHIITTHGEWSITDDDSTAGTQVNEQLLASGQTVKLADRDRISLGYVGLVFTPSRDFHGFIRSLFGR